MPARVIDLQEYREKTADDRVGALIDEAVDILDGDDHTRASAFLDAHGVRAAFVLQPKQLWGCADGRLQAIEYHMHAGDGDALVISREIFDGLHVGLEELSDLLPDDAWLCVVDADDDWDPGDEGEPIPILRNAMARGR